MAAAASAKMAASSARRAEAAAGSRRPAAEPPQEEEERLLLSPGRPAVVLGPDQASPLLATPSAFYRSAFAGECEAIALQLRGEGGRGRRPRQQRGDLPPPPSSSASSSRYPSTLEGEALTPLGAPSWSFFCEAFQTPAGLPARPARPPPEQASASPPPGTPNRTYDCEEADSCATYLCQESWEELSGAAPGGASSFASGGLPVRDGGGGGDAPQRRETFELPAALDDPPAGRPLVTSTPLLAEGSEPPCGGGQRRSSALGLEEVGDGGGGGGRLGLGPETESSSSSSRSQTRTARPRPTTVRGGGEAARKGPLAARKSLALLDPSAAKGTRKSLAAAGAAGAASLLPPKGKGGVERAIPQRTPGSGMPIHSALPGKRPGCAQQNQPRVQKQLPDEMKKPLSKLPSYKNTSGPTQAPASLTRGAGADGFLTCAGLEPNVCAENGTRGTRLPVRTAGDKRSKVGVQKRPPEKLADSSTSLKQPLPKRPCQGRGLMEKRTGGLPLLAAGQIPRVATGNGLVAPCLQCQRLSEENQRLTEENQQLKAMLDNLSRKEAQAPVNPHEWVYYDSSGPHRPHRSWKRK